MYRRASASDQLLATGSLITVNTPSGRWQSFCNSIEGFLAADTIEMSIDDVSIVGYRSPDSASLWIRDHSDIIRGGRYFAKDMRHAVDAFVSTQSASGRVFDFVTTLPTTGSNERENWEKWVRVAVEADVEYRLVNAAFRTWQANGDDAWIKSIIPALEKALDYSTSHPLRWDEERGLVKRAYTIDTWDFDYTAGRHDWLNFQITDHTFWGIMHGDNSGVYEGLRSLATLHGVFGNDDEKNRLTEKAEQLKQRANALLFNGNFYTHFHKLTPVVIDGVDESKQLTLSNPMDINRGLATTQIADAILKTYQSRAASSDSFAEWFSVDPPFPVGVFGDEKLVPGSYCNGGIMPLVGGELARAALENGHEEYGVAILDKYRNMIQESGETFLWYFPDGTPSSVENSTSPDAMPTDGWGSSAMLWALVEGLAGVQDLLSSFRSVRLSPRWVATGENDADVRVTYPASDASFEYTYKHDLDTKSITLVVGSRAEVQAHVMLPTGATAVGVRKSDDSVPFDNVSVGKSSYVDFVVSADPSTQITIDYAV